jgi:hypothetical protein
MTAEGISTNVSLRKMKIYSICLLDTDYLKGLSFEFQQGAFSTSFDLFFIYDHRVKVFCYNSQAP